MKAQGLSVSFVVVAALAILVLVLAAAFLLGAFGTGKQQTQMQAARTTCNNFCSEIQSQISTVDCTTGTTTGDACIAEKAASAYNKFCGTSFNIAGNTYNCTALTKCVVTDAMGNQITVTCDNYNG